MKIAIIPVESGDTFETLKRKISQDRANRVLLVLPDQQSASRRKPGRKESLPNRRKYVKPIYNRVEFILLDRFCRKMGRRLGLVTRDKMWLELAAETNLPVFPDLVHAEDSEWEDFTKNRLIRPVRKQKSALLQERKNHTQFGFALKITYPIRWLIFLSGVMAVICLAWLFVPSAQMVLVMKEQPQTIQLRVRANPEIQSIQVAGDIPANQLSVLVDGEGEITSTSTIILADQAATGRIQLTNLTDQTISVPAGTKVLTVTENPAAFLTTLPVDVVPKGEIEVPVQAVHPGSQGNVPAGAIQAFVDQMGLSLLVTNLEPTSGGTNRVGPIPSEQDADDLREQILDELDDQALSKFNTIMQDGQILIPDTIQIDSILNETRIPPAGEPGEVLRLRLQVQFTVWVVQESDLESLAGSALDANLDNGFTVLPETLQITTVSQPVKDAAGVSWEIAATRMIKPSGDAIKLENFTNIKVQEAIAMLESLYSYQTAPTITIKPSWWKRMPFLDHRMELVIQ